MNQESIQNYHVFRVIISSFEAVFNNFMGQIIFYNSEFDEQFNSYFLGLAKLPGAAVYPQR